MAPLLGRGRNSNRAKLAPTRVRRGAFRWGANGGIRFGEPPLRGLRIDPRCGIARLRTDGLGLDAVRLLRHTVALNTHGLGLDLNVENGIRRIRDVLPRLAFSDQPHKLANNPVLILRIPIGVAGVSDELRHGFPFKRSGNTISGRYCERVKTPNM